MRSPALALLLILPSLFSAGASAQATLNKCIDAEGQVTYSNLPCRNAQAARRIEIDPPPPVPVVVRPPAPAPVPARPAASPLVPPPAATAVPAPAAAAPFPVPTPAPAAPPVVSRRPAVRQCDALSEQLGRVFDKMDQARSKGATQKQRDEWNQEIKTLEQKKRQSGCF